MLTRRLLITVCLYLDKDFLEQRPAVSKGQLRMGGALAWNLFLGGWCWCWWRRRWCWWLWGGAYRSLSHVWQVEEQVDAFD